MVAVGAEANSGAFDFRVGDRVAVNPSTTCGECEFCQNGHQNLCRFWDGLGVVASDGAAQQFFTARASHAFRLRPETDLYEAALIEPLACAIRGWDVLPRRARRPSSSRLRDDGAAHGAARPARGAASVTIVDLNEDRLATAAECGIEHRYTSADHAGRESGTSSSTAPGASARSRTR